MKFMKQKRYWLRGGIVGLVFYIFLVLYILQSNIWGLNSISFFSHLIFAVVFFFVGFIAGFLYGKIKSISQTPRLILLIVIIGLFFFGGIKGYSKYDELKARQKFDKSCAGCLSQIKDYKLALAYIYSSDETYNPNWQENLEKIGRKTESGLFVATNGKLKLKIETLGSTQVDTFYWNPAILGGKFENIETGNIFSFRMPGSDFSSTGLGINGWKIIESKCTNCKITETDGGLYELDRKNGLSYKNMFEKNMVYKLENEVRKKFKIDTKKYDGVIIVFGKLGNVSSKDSEEARLYRCNSLSSVIGGYSSLILAENVIESGGLIDCTNTGATSYYESSGWHKLAHEILHRFGATDIYETGGTFGINTEDSKKRAFDIDNRAAESIMGEDAKVCMGKDKYVRKDNKVCTQIELDEIYIDKYNRQLIGLE